VLIYLSICVSILNSAIAYNKFWEGIDVIEKNIAYFEDESLMQSDRDNILGFFRTVSTNAMDTNSKLAPLLSKLKNKKVKHHFNQRYSLYGDALNFSVNYEEGKSELPNVKRFYDDMVRRKAFLENEYLKLKNEL
jgi:hypothetical protein